MAVYAVVAVIALPTVPLTVCVAGDSAAGTAATVIVTVAVALLRSESVPVTV